MSRPLPFTTRLLHAIVLGTLVLPFVLVSRSSMAPARADEGDSAQPVALTGTSTPPDPAWPASEPGTAVLDVQPAAASDAAAAPELLPRSWLAVVGATFMPANSGYSYQYGSAGCLRPSSGGYWRAPVSLPDRSVARVLSIAYKNDTYSGSSTSWLTRYRTNGDYQDVAFVSSRTYTTTGTGYFVDISGAFTETIDNEQYGYVFIWSGSTTQRLCSVRVGYDAPLFGSALPAVLK